MEPKLFSLHWSNREGPASAPASEAKRKLEIKILRKTVGKIHSDLKKRQSGGKLSLKQRRNHHMITKKVARVSRIRAITSLVSCCTRF